MKTINKNGFVEFSHADVSVIVLEAEPKTCYVGGLGFRLAIAELAEDQKVNYTSANMLELGYMHRHHSDHLFLSPRMYGIPPAP